MEKKPWNSLSVDWIDCIRLAADLHEYPNTRAAAHVGFAATHARTITAKRPDDSQDSREFIVVLGPGAEPCRRHLDYVPKHAYF